MLSNSRNQVVTFNGDAFQEEQIIESQSCRSTHELSSERTTVSTSGLLMLSKDHNDAEKMCILQLKRIDEREKLNRSNTVMMQLKLGYRSQHKLIGKDFLNNVRLNREEMKDKTMVCDINMEKWRMKSIHNIIFQVYPELLVDDVRRTIYS
uniref:Uncharacterized protein n=1 Tax=Romanomermis culicivorax TaxID=13658 RepID=A0A915K385_ROMCU